MKKDSEAIAKEAAGRAAAALVQDGMIIGLGTGSTAAFFIDHLAKRIQQGLTIHAVPTSKQSAEIAKAKGIPLADLDQVTHIDLTVDGADEIDPQKQMIKGGGGALLREKITASASKEMVVIVDASKCVPALGNFPLPIEVAPFIWRATQAKLLYKGELRLREGKPYVTDNGNYILDLQLPYASQDLQKIDQTLSAIPGVLATGLFLGLAGRVIIGYSDGHTEIMV